MEQNNSNAMEQNISEARESIQVNAASEDSGQLVVISKGTLSIKDLANAQGVTNSTVSAPPPAPSDEMKEEAEEDRDN